VTTAPQRVVFDTNVLLSLYVFADSRFMPLRQQIELGRWQAFTNAACLAEFKRVLDYPIFGLDQPTQQQAFMRYSGLAKHFSGEPLHDFVLPKCKDRDDQKFLELARDAAAGCLITADKALLILARRQKMAERFRILTPDAALTELTLKVGAGSTA
jgi:putative PIN family toxin of toxin-antitoxin system